MRRVKHYCAPDSGSDPFADSPGVVSTSRLADPKHAPGADAEMSDVPGSILKRLHCSAVMKKTILRTKSYRSFIQAEDFLRDGSNVYRTYFTRGRGSNLGTNFSYLDLTPYGRQENWGGLARGLAANSALRVVAAPR